MEKCSSDWFYKAFPGKREDYRWPCVTVRHRSFVLIPAADVAVAREWSRHNRPTGKITPVIVGVTDIVPSGEWVSVTETAVKAYGVPWGIDLDHLVETVELMNLLKKKSPTSGDI